jgi:hydroxymethylbilane synthase
MTEFVLATRGSELALRQAQLVRSALSAHHHGLAVREEILRTTGDRYPDEALTSLGGSGVFTKELERAVLDGRADAAVHSLKDLPVDLPPGLAFGAVLPRADPGDVLVSRYTGGVAGLPPRARIGTGSPRRRAMMLALRDDVQVVPIRGNVPTRMAKAVAGEFDAVILAAAGLERLGFATRGEIAVAGRALQVVALPTFLPAPGQGAIAVEIRADDRRAADLLSALDDRPTSAAVRAERAVLRALGGGCHLPLGARGLVRDGVLRLEAVLFDAAGAPPKHAALEGSAGHPEELGAALARKLHGQ